MFGVFEACLLNPLVLRKVLFRSFIRRFITTFMLTINLIFNAQKQLKFIISLSHVTAMLDSA